MRRVLWGLVCAFAWLITCDRFSSVTDDLRFERTPRTNSQVQNGANRTEFLNANLQISPPSAPEMLMSAELCGSSRFSWNRDQTLRMFYLLFFQVMSGFICASEEVLPSVPVVNREHRCLEVSFCVFNLSFSCVVHLYLCFQRETHISFQGVFKIIPNYIILNPWIDFWLQNVQKYIKYVGKVFLSSKKFLILSHRPIAHTVASCDAHTLKSITVVANLRGAGDYFSTQLMIKSTKKH